MGRFPILTSHVLIFQRFSQLSIDQDEVGISYCINELTLPCYRFTASPRPLPLQPKNHTLPCRHFPSPLQSTCVLRAIPSNSLPRTLLGKTPECCSLQADFFISGIALPAQPLPESVSSSTFRWFPHLLYVSLSIADSVRWRPDRPRGAPVLSSSPSLRMFLGESPSEEKQTARASHQRRFTPSC